MKISLRDAFIATVCYADVFSYPLRDDELVTWMIDSPYGGKTKIPSCVNITRTNVRGQRYYVLAERRSILYVRKKRALWSLKKQAIAARIVGFLRAIPTVEFIGITGGVAMNNAKRDDDIDLYIVANTGTIWITRFLATLLVDFVGIRRHPNDRTYQDAICLNMFVDASALAVPRSERDLFTAHEVLQMIPLWDRNHTYQQFLQANRWVKTFLPQAWQERLHSVQGKVHSTKKNIRPYVFFVLYRFTVYCVLCTVYWLEPLSRSMQLWYMRKRRSTEVVTDKVIRFHPLDARVWIKAELAGRLSRYKIPLDKIFYDR